jgi:hypothetical protein
MASPAFLLRLLRIAADDADLNPDDLEFAVITGGRTDIVGDPNNPRTAGKIFKSREVSFYPFKKGEIIVLPKDGYREPFSPGRSTSKYSVGAERFGHDWEAAKRRHDEVLAAPDRDAFAYAGPGAGV